MSDRTCRIHSVSLNVREEFISHNYLYRLTWFSGEWATTRNSAVLIWAFKISCYVAVLSLGKKEAICIKRDDLVLAASKNKDPNVSYLSVKISWRLISVMERTIPWVCIPAACFKMRKRILQPLLIRRLTLFHQTFASSCQCLSWMMRDRGATPEVNNSQCQHEHNTSIWTAQSHWTGPCWAESLCTDSLLTILASGVISGRMWLTLNWWYTIKYTETHVYLVCIGTTCTSSITRGRGIRIFGACAERNKNPQL